MAKRPTELDEAISITERLLQYNLMLVDRGEDQLQSFNQWILEKEASLQNLKNTRDAHIAAMEKAPERVEAYRARLSELMSRKVAEKASPQIRKYLKLREQLRKLESKIADDITAEDLELLEQARRTQEMPSL